MPTLPPEQRFNPTRVRFGEDAEPLVLFPSVSIGDLLNQISLERWMLDLRRHRVVRVSERFGETSFRKLKPKDPDRKKKGKRNVAEELMGYADEPARIIRRPDLR